MVDIWMMWFNTQVATANYLMNGNSLMFQGDSNDY